jgi:DNA-binding MarR family transcriptional regulator/GNAT superfamily N-acetyltransferase
LLPGEESVAHSAETTLPLRIAAVRSFNRFYTRQIGLLQDGLHRSEFSLAEARLLYELAQNDGATATWLANQLGLDPGYLSRIVSKFLQRRLIERLQSEADRRQHQLRLSAKGRQAFARLDRGSEQEVAAMLATLSRGDQERLIGAMRAIETILSAQPKASSYVLRPHRAGDMGWVVSRHGVLYAEEYHWDLTFEALVAEIVAEFVRHYDATREQCWIAEVDGEPVGSVFLVKETNAVAKLRLLLVEPKARGLGIGQRLVSECIRFARHSGYRSVTLWTQSNLTAAHRIYERAGFARVGAEPHKSFGHELVGETWTLSL